MNLLARVRVPQARWLLRLHEEQGIALVTAMLISMVVVILGGTSATLSIHNSEESAYDRRRTQSIHAAEAGINFYFSHVQSVDPSHLECSVSSTLSPTSPARFDVTASFFDAAGNSLSCPLGSQQPDAVVITSVGRGGEHPPERVMQAEVKLVPVPGGPFGELAVFSHSDPQFNANVRIVGGEAVQGDVYSNGNVVLNSNSTVYGNIEAQGSVTLNSNSQVKRNVFAKAGVQMNSNAVVFQDVTSATSSLAMSGNARIFGAARAGAQITRGSNTAVDGGTVPAAPSTPPEVRAFPSVTFDPAAWVQAGYLVHSIPSCLEAKTLIATLPTGSHVVRIPTACDLSYMSTEQIPLRGNLAIVSNGSLTMNSNTAFVNVGGEHTLFLLFGLAGAGPCNVSFRSNSGIGSGIESVIYTPCTIDLRSNTMVVEGQMFGGSVQFNANASLTYEPIGVPGNGVSTFDEDILYMREVVG